MLNHAVNPGTVVGRSLASACTLGLVLAGVVVLAEPAAADPVERFVASGGADAGDCSVDPCATVSYAVGESVAGDIISVDAGTFPADITIGIDLTIVGTVVAGVNQTLIHTTDGDTVTVTGAANVTLQSLDISGDAAAADFGNWEYPVTNEGTGTLTIVDSSVQDLDVEVVKNNSTGTLIVTGSSIGGSGGNAGVSNNSTGRIEISDSTVSDNNGPGVSASSGTATGPIVIESTIITGNAMEGVSNFGGADIQITDSTIAGNGDLSPNEYPGIRGGTAGTITVLRSTISGNKGGAIVNGHSDGSSTSRVVVISSTLDGGDDVGISTYGPASSVLIGSTVYSPTGAVGSWSAGGSEATVTMAGTFVFNQSGDPAPCAGNSDFVDLGYNVAYTDPDWGEYLCDFTESTSTDTEPTVIGSLQDNGGPTETRAPGAAAPTMETIPAGTTVEVDGVDYHLCAGTDQRGVPRPQGTNCEPGAVELVASSVALTAAPEPSEAGENFTLTATVSSGISSPELPPPTGTVAFYPEGSSTPLTGCEAVAVDSATGQADCVTSAATPGTFGYVAAYSGALSAYLDSESQPYDHEVSKQIITVTASSETMSYGGTVPTVTASYTGFEGIDDESDIDTPASCSVNVSAATTSCSGAADDVYDFVYVTGTLTVEPVTLTVTGSNEVMTYGDMAPVPSPVYSGFVNDDDEDDLDTAPVCFSVPSGPYTQCFGGSDSNYDFFYVPGVLTVQPTTLTVTASDESMTYGGAEPVPTPSYSGFAPGEDDSVVTVAPTCTVDVAARTTSCTGGDAGPHYQLDYVSGDLTVNKVVLTVTASNASMVYGEALPPVTPSYSGFIPGDDESDLDTAAGCTADPTTLTTNCSGGVSANYSFDYVAGTLTVTPAPLVVDTTALPEAMEGEFYSASLAAHGSLGGPYSWSLDPTSSLPGGLSLASDGTVSGTPGEAGDFSFVVLLDGQIPATVTLTITAAALAFTGADVLPLGLAALLAILLGAGVFVLVRRRLG